MSATYRVACRSLSLDFGGDILFHWTTADHMAAYHVVQDIYSLKSKVLESLSIMRKSKSVTDAPKVMPRRSKEISLLLKWDGWAFLSAQLTFHTRQGTESCFCSFCVVEMLNYLLNYQFGAGSASIFVVS